MKFHAADDSCRFRSFAEAERYADRSCEQAEQSLAALPKMRSSYGVYEADGRVCYSPPKDKSRIKRMCLGCRRREVFGRARYCDNPRCIRARKSKDRLLGPSESSTYLGSYVHSATTLPGASNLGVNSLSPIRQSVTVRLANSGGRDFENGFHRRAA